MIAGLCQTSEKNTYRVFFHKFVQNTYRDITLIRKWEGELKRGSLCWLQNIV